MAGSQLLPEDVADAPELLVLATLMALSTASLLVVCLSLGVSAITAWLSCCAPAPSR